MEKLPQLIADAEKMQRGLLPPDPEWVLSRGSGYNSLKNYITMLVAYTDGEHGQQLALAPEEAQFLKDPKNIGIFEQWQREEVAAGIAWQPISLLKDWGLNGYHDEQNYPYDGIGWYRIVMSVKKPAHRRAQLIVPRINASKVWVWVNGALVFSPTSSLVQLPKEPTPDSAVFSRGWMAIDVQDSLRPDGENSFVFRMIGRGILELPFIWLPKQ